MVGGGVRFAVVVAVCIATTTASPSKTTKRHGNDVLRYFSLDGPAVPQPLSLDEPVPQPPSLTLQDLQEARTLEELADAMSDEEVALTSMPDWEEEDDANCFCDQPVCPKHPDCCEGESGALASAGELYECCTAVLDPPKPKTRKFVFKRMCPLILPTSEAFDRIGIPLTKTPRAMVNGHLCTEVTEEIMRWCEVHKAGDESECLCRRFQLPIAAEHGPCKQVILEDTRRVMPCYTLSKWMGHVPDEARINQMTIPGSHDTAAWAFADSTRWGRGGTLLTNDHIIMQLEAGLRFFDLRVGWSKAEGKVVTCHTSVVMHYSLTNILAIMREFLKFHRTETIFFTIKNECGTHGLTDKDFADKVVDALFQGVNVDQNCEYMFPEKPVWPITPIGELRGKLVPVHTVGWDQLSDWDDAWSKKKRRKLPLPDSSHGKPSQEEESYHYLTLRTGFPENAIVQNKFMEQLHYFKAYFSPYDTARAAKARNVTAHFKTASSDGVSNSVYVNYMSVAGGDITRSSADVNGAVLAELRTPKWNGEQTFCHGFGMVLTDFVLRFDDKDRLTDDVNTELVGRLVAQNFRLEDFGLLSNSDGRRAQAQAVLDECQ